MKKNMGILIIGISVSTAAAMGSQALFFSGRAMNSNFGAAGGKYVPAVVQSADSLSLTEDVLPEMLMNQLNAFVEEETAIKNGDSSDSFSGDEAIGGLMEQSRAILDESSAKDFVLGLLDLELKGDFTRILEATGYTKAELEEKYGYSDNWFYEDFAEASLVAGLDISEAVMRRIAEETLRIYSFAEYEIVSASQVGEEFVVVVEYRKVLNMELCEDYIANTFLTMDFESILVLSDEELFSLMFDLTAEALSIVAQKPEYGETVRSVVTLGVDGGGYYWDEQDLEWLYIGMFGFN